MLGGGPRSRPGVPARSATSGWQGGSPAGERGVGSSTILIGQGENVKACFTVVQTTFWFGYLSAALSLVMSQSMISLPTRQL